MADLLFLIVEMGKAEHIVRKAVHFVGKLTKMYALNQNIT